MLTETDPELVAEARAFLEVLRPMMERTKAGTGETVRFTLSIPVEDAMLAAWLVLKNKLRHEGQHGPLRRPIMLKREGDGYRMADWQWVKTYLHAAIEARLALEWGYLEGGTHPLLSPAPPPEPYRSTVDPDCDDDIPF